MASPFVVIRVCDPGLVPAGVDAEFSTSMVLPQHPTLPNQLVAILILHERPPAIFRLC